MMTDCSTMVSTRGISTERSMAKPPVCSAANNTAAMTEPTGLAAGEQRGQRAGPGILRRRKCAVGIAELRPQDHDRPDQSGDGAAGDHDPERLPG